MKKSKIAFCFLICSATTNTAFADVSIDTSCHVNVAGEVHYQDAQLKIFTQSNNEIVFTEDETIEVNGKRLMLTRQQQKDARLYYQSVTEAIPMTLDIATDAMTLASETVNEVMGDILGHDDSMKEEINDLFTDLETNLDNRFTSDQGGFILRGEDISHNGWVSSAWESEFEQRVDDLVSKVAGKLLISIGTEMLFGNGENSDMFSRLETLDTRIEQRVEGKAERIEQKADQLCVVLEKADLAENALSYSHEALTELNILSIDHKNAE